mgnify:CR=1 FL=1
MVSDCIFCAIVAGEAPASVVLDEPDVIAFLDIRPFTAGHLLVVPKRHASGLADLAPGDGPRIFDAATRIASVLRSGVLPGGPITASGVNLLLADGAAAGQEVFHVHLHVIPRRRGDGVGLRAMPGNPNRTVLDGTAAVIREALVR